MHRNMVKFNAKKKVMIGKVMVPAKSIPKLERVAKKLSRTSKERYGEHISAENMKQILVNAVDFRRKLKAVKTKFLTSKLTKEKAMSELNNIHFNLGDISRAGASPGFSRIMSTFRKKEVLQALHFVNSSPKKYKTKRQIPLIFTELG